jgi:response regulator RpfG family c-di-GMP phosphodiesterase
MEFSQDTIKLLIAEEDVQVAETIRSCFPSPRYQCAIATRAPAALELLKQNQFSVVLCAIRLPGMDGLELLRRGMDRSPHSAFLILSDPLDLNLAIEAKTRGACGYLEKPFDCQQLVSVVEQVMENQRSKAEQEIVHTLAEQTLHERTGHLHQVLQQAGEIQQATLEVLVVALDARENQTNLHSLRVQRFTLMLAKRFGYRQSGMKQLSYGALLHDIGKIAIPDSILLKPAKLTPEEMQIVRHHAKYGYQVLSRIPHLQDAAMLALMHHERIDGTGYPMGLGGNEISIEARIFAVVDALDVITAGRPYCPARSLEEAREEIVRCTGTQFDSEVVDVFLSIPNEEWKAAREDVSRHYEGMLPILKKPAPNASASKLRF